MPSEQGVGLDKESSSSSSRQEPAQSGERRSIRWLEGWTHYLSAQDGDLVTEHDHLDGQLLLLATYETTQLEQTDEGDVQEGERHASSSSLNLAIESPGPLLRMTFSAPTGW
jgi:hypothetical protein